MRLALVTIALFATAASRGGCGSTDPAYDPCAAKACGDACRVCPPDDPSCVETADVKACDSAGRCVSAGTFTAAGCAAQPTWGCAGKSCGDYCGYCPPGTDPAYCPVQTLVATACDDKGECVTQGTFTCGTVDPCAGKKCGETCNACAPAACMTAVVTACDPAGKCVPANPYLCYDACAGKTCGDSCQLCPPGDTTCVSVMCVTACDGAGSCTCDTPGLCR